MKTAWRLVPETHLADAFTGLGAKIAGGRWNHAGIPVVYVSETLSLAALELFVHFSRENITLSRSLMSIPIFISPSIRIKVLNVQDLPHDWRISPPPDSTRDIGSAWAKEKQSAILQVPSVIIPAENNLVLNPEHPDFKKLKTGDPVPFQIDNRLIK